MDQPVERPAVRALLPRPADRGHRRGALRRRAGRAGRAAQRPAAARDLRRRRSPRRARPPAPWPTCCASTPACPATPPALASRLGLIGGDAAGFPNGRRLFDDVTDITLRVAVGGVLAAPFPGFNAGVNGELGRRRQRERPALSRRASPTSARRPTGATAATSTPASRAAGPSTDAIRPTERTPCTSRARPSASCSGVAHRGQAPPSAASAPRARRSRPSPRSTPHHNDLAAGPGAAGARDGRSRVLRARPTRRSKRSRELAPDDLRRAARRGLDAARPARVRRAPSRPARELNREVPDDSMVYGFLVDACVELGRYAEAEEACQWMLDLRPGNVPGLTRAAYLRELFGDLEGAARAARQRLRRCCPRARSRTGPGC